MRTLSESQPERSDQTISRSRRRGALVMVEFTFVDMPEGVVAGRKATGSTFSLESRLLFYGRRRSCENRHDRCH
jgi:hypothetical protein